MKLDESMRARLRALAKSEPTPTLEGAARARAQRAALEASAGERKARGIILYTVAMASAAALVLSVVSSLDTRGAESLARTRAAPVTPPPMQAAFIEPPRSEPVGPCADAPILPFPPGSGERRLDLGSRALFVANRPAIVGVTQTADCDLHAGLAEGGLAVHARNLEGHALVVSTARGDVRVKGTVFEVEFWASSGEMTVGVEEGTVELVTAEGQTVSLTAGQAAYLGVKVELEPFEEGQRAHLRRVLGLSAKRAHGKERESGEESARPPAEAEAPVRAWRSGNLDAPAQAPEPGSSITEDGRPMAKPKLKRRSESRREAPQEGEQE